MKNQKNSTSSGGHTSDNHPHVGMIITCVASGFFGKGGIGAARAKYKFFEFFRTEYPGGGEIKKQVSSGRAPQAEIFL